MSASRAKVVVTGASGHLGFHVARLVCKEDAEVLLLVRRLNENVAELVRLGAQYVIIDFRDQAACVEHLKEANCLFHCAAENTTEQSQPERVLQSTIGLTETLLTAALNAGVQTIVYTSSVVVLGRSNDPQRLLGEEDRTKQTESPYVRGKVEADALCERLIRERGADIRRLYPSWIMGPDDLRGTPPHQVVNRFLQKGQKFYFDGGVSITGVEAVAEAHMIAWRKGKAKESYVLGGENVTFNTLFSLLAELSGNAPPRVKIPKPLMVVAATILKAAMGSRAPVDPAYVRTVVGSYSWYDSKKAREALGYTIPDIRTTLRSAILGERKRIAQTYSLGRSRGTSSSVPHEERRPSVSSGEQMPPLLITGAPGWLGNRFIDSFVNGLSNGFRPQPRKVRLLVEARNVSLLDLPTQFEVVPGDICDPVAVYEALEGIGTVFHLAGAIYPPKIQTLYRVNYDGTRNLVDQCLKRGVRRILFMGTDSICGHGTRKKRIFDEDTPDRPYRHYGQSKWLAERYVLEKTAQGQIDGTSLRGFWFFGPFAPARQQNFLNMMHWRRQLVFGSGKNFRSLSHVDNTISAFFAAEPVRKTYGKWYWIGDRKPDYTVDQVYEFLCRGAKNSYRPVHIPAAVCGLMRGLDWFMAKAGRLHPTIHGMGKFSFDIAGTIEAAARDFGYQPVICFEEYAARAYDSTGP